MSERKYQKEIIERINREKNGKLSITDIDDLVRNVGKILPINDLYYQEKNNNEK